MSSSHRNRLPSGRVNQSAGLRADAGGASRTRSSDPVGPRRNSVGSEPTLPVDVDLSVLDRPTLNSLRTLPEGLAEKVARHLAMAESLIEEDPAEALAHARAAARQAGRVGVVREAVGLAAYRVGEYAEALSELRAAARISGIFDYLPMMADCERGLGRPDRALQLAASPEVSRLPKEGKVEMLIVASGARKDLGQFDAAVLTLQVPALQSPQRTIWVTRLRYAYADALLAAGRTGEARDWFQRAAQSDDEDTTDAWDRVHEIDISDSTTHGKEKSGEDVTRPGR
jgi:tetratricopeptide (TPR) repeat protein